VKGRLSRVEVAAQVSDEFTVGPHQGATPGELSTIGETNAAFAEERDGELDASWWTFGLRGVTPRSARQGAFDGSHLRSHELEQGKKHHRHPVPAQAPRTKILGVPQKKGPKRKTA